MQTKTNTSWYQKFRKLDPYQRETILREAVKEMLKITDMTDDISHDILDIVENLEKEKFQPVFNTAWYTITHGINRKAKQLYKQIL